MKTLKTLKLLILIFFIPVAVAAQNGSVSGVVKDRKSNETLIGTTVAIEGTTLGATTDIDGKFTIQNVKPGVYRVKVSYISYNTQVFNNVKVEPGKPTSLDVTMEESSVTLNDVTVTAIRKTNTDISVISAIKSSPFVATGISSQQISRTQDKDASEVVKRVPGITIQDDRFLVVRGLSQRYNNVWLNNAATPSSEADVKAFSFDVIPSSMIENIMIYKAPAAELPADFSGGFVKIATKNMPEKNGFFINYGTGFSEGTTFGSFYKFKGSSTDFLGFDNGTRALPSDMPYHLSLYETATNPAVRENISLLGQELNNNWKASPASAFPDQKLLVGINKKFSVGNLTVGNVTSLNYSLSNNSDAVDVVDYSIYDFVNDRPSYLNQFRDMHYSNSARTTIMHNWSLLIGNNSKIEFRNLFNQAGSSRASFRSGREWYNDGRHVMSNELRYLSRAIYSGQLAGEHTIGKGKTKLEWIAGYAFSNKNEPDTKRYRYIRDNVDTTKYMMIFADQADLSSQARMWIDLTESTVSGAVNVTRQFNFNSFTPEVKAGLYYENKNREFNARNFGYAKASTSSTFGQAFLPVEDIFTASNLNLTDGIRLSEITALSDSYDASNLQIAGYLSARLPLTSKINLYAGLRLERNRQTLSSYKQGSTVEVNVNRDTLNIFPSANLTYNFTEKHLVRASYGMSVNRPEFREIAPFYYVDFELNAGIYGAPQIRQAYIHNFDLRYEAYPRQGETYTFGAFYKHFENPIEQVILGNSPTQYSFENVLSAYSYGIETESRKSLDFLPGMKNFSVVMNASLIASRVQFDPGKLSRNRPLEGQSPYIVNAGLYYHNENKGLMLTLLYNVIGKRIAAVGRPSPNEWEDIPNIYELPRNVIDFTFSKMIGDRIEIKGGIKDLLNQKVRFVQQVKTLVDMDAYSQGTESGLKYFDRDQITKSYLQGRYISIGISVKL